MTAFFDFGLKITRAEERLRTSTESGFALFSAWHVLYLALGAALICLLVRVYCRAAPKRRRKLGLGIASCALFVELARATLLALAGCYGISHLPLHLCTMAVYLCFAHALRGGELLGQFLYAFCMPGAISALLFPDWRRYPPTHPVVLSCFALHIFIVAYVLARVVAHELVPDVRATPRALLLMLALAVPVYIFDRLTGMNYMFLSYPPEGSPLALFAALGSPGYLLGYIPLLALAWALIYAPWLKPRHAGRD